MASPRLMNTWYISGSTAFALAPTEALFVGTRLQPSTFWPSSSTIVVNSAMASARAPSCREAKNEPTP